MKIFKIEEELIEAIIEEQKREEIEHNMFLQEMEQEEKDLIDYEKFIDFSGFAY